MSEPRAKSHKSAATAAAEPEEEPPGMSWGSVGFRVGPNADVSPLAPHANSSMFIIPRIIASSVFSLLITVALNGATKFSKTFEPQFVVKFFTQIFDLTAKHRPANFPVCFFCLILLSISFACSIAFLFKWRKMLSFFVFGVAIFFENCIRLSTAFSFPDLIFWIFCFSILILVFLFSSFFLFF